MSTKPLGMFNYENYPLIVWSWTEPDLMEYTFLDFLERNTRSRRNKHRVSVRENVKMTIPGELL